MFKSCVVIVTKRKAVSDLYIIKKGKYKILQHGYEVRIYDQTSDKLCFTKSLSCKAPKTELSQILNDYILKGGKE